MNTPPEMTAPPEIAGVAPAPAPAVAVELRHLSHRYGEVLAVDDVSLDIIEGEFLTLLGPSGSGKSTLLMMIAGFLAPTSGHILMSGRDIGAIPPYRREMGMVFQNYALFPHMTVAANIGYPLRLRKLPRAEIRRRVDEALDMVGLGGLGGRTPRQLSGGQQQRVALARAFVFEPKVLLMDEPLGALDKKLRQQMQVELKRIHRQLGVTVVYVTHDQEEALTMSDRIVVMRTGRLEQVGPPAEVYNAPRSAFAADFLGDSNLVTGRCVERAGELVRIAVGDDRSLWAAGGCAVDATVTVSIRPEQLHIAPAGGAAADALNRWPGTITDKVYLGDAVRYRVDTGGTFLLAKRQEGGATRQLDVGAGVELTWPPERATVLEAP
ncbi:ABC transporter ATP-binding protein [Dactylosporangium sp. CA-092794]|uniref:ABC transporter ATP-binding protein n=1 Tax=Dactylosporangium sp. CA-092794 TaxID=3239929 RepID=UPI003D9412B7